MHVVCFWHGKYKLLVQILVPISQKFIEKKHISSMDTLYLFTTYTCRKVQNFRPFLEITCDYSFLFGLYGWIFIHLLVWLECIFACIISCNTKIFFYVVMSLGAPWPITATTAGRSTPPPQAVHRKNSDLDPAGSHQRYPFEHVVALLQQRGSATALGGGQSLSSSFELHGSLVLEHIELADPSFLCS